MTTQAFIVVVHSPIFDGRDGIVGSRRQVHRAFRNLRLARIVAGALQDMFGPDDAVVRIEGEPLPPLPRPPQSDCPF